ncbi:acyl carrier protein [Micromonospora sp. STR1_7]|uniref:Acyl carrier protein n=1 Tax=Micromonospora parastrephiae TaxID=2806101 RepID=A0ABS1XTG5_9ACTN|nr:acyl carrier protein [Micromonospora parastrephiae]MBM0232561.1 acyl carrier protein [Micromonospora parastrephiae]
MTENSTGLVDKEDLRETLAEILDIDSEEITDDANFVDDLGVDSLMALEITVRLEKKYGVRMQENELVEVTSLNKTCRLLTEKLGGQP